jgi:hypothetical protein
MKIVSTFILLCLAIPAIAASPGSSAPLPPSAVVFGNSYSFYDGTETYPKVIIVPTDGAWFYGEARYSGASWMDCSHHYQVDLGPPSLSPDYTPFISLGYVDGLDTPCVFSNACFSCTVNFGGFKARSYYTTSNGPGWLPSGAGQAVLRSLNGGGGSSLPGDAVSFFLNQVNADAMQSMKVFEALTNDLPAEPGPDEINARAYIAATDDRVPLVPQFIYGVDTYPAPPTATFTAAWDTGDVPEVVSTNPYGHPGNVVLQISIPRMKTGKHKITVKATLPSGKIYVAQPYEVFIYNAALEATVAGSAAVSSPATFTRGQNVIVRLKQQDTSGKTIAVAQADWEFRQPVSGVTITSTAEPGFAANSKEWGGVMHQGGLVLVNLTLKTGKYKRVSHAALVFVLTAQARTGVIWTTVQNLCSDCWDDLGVKNGGDLKNGLFFPSWQNIKYSSAPFPANNGGGITLGLSGDRRTYENGLKDGTGAYIIEPRTIMKGFPLYRPSDVVNDPSEWPNRYTLAEITTGPNRGYWYVTTHTYKTEWSYALNAYFVAGSAQGAVPANYKSFQLTGTGGCTSYVAQESCYAATTLPCWAAVHGTSAYYQEATTTNMSGTSTPYNMPSVAAAVRAHEKNRHWQAWLVNYVAANKAKYDVGTLMEAITTREATLANAQLAIDVFMKNMMLAYATDPLGGGNEVYTDPIPKFPIVDDAGATTLPPCSFFD